MKRPIILIAFLTALAWGQPPLAFDAASIRPAEHFTKDRRDASHVYIGYMQLINLIRSAYHVDRYQVVGPDWLDPAKDSQHWDVEAAIPPNVSPDKVPEMLQALLADRFGLRCHEETRTMLLYALTTGPHPPNLRKSIIPLTADGQPDPSFMISSTSRGFDLKRATVPFFAGQLSRYVGRPVVDQTGIEGRYDFSMRFDQAVSTSAETAAEPPASSIFAVVRDLGFKLEKRNMPVRAIVIDHLEKMPTQN